MRRLNAKSHIGKGPAVAWRGRWPGPRVRRDAPHPSGVSLAVGMVGIERSRSTEPSTLARSIRARSVVATRVGLFGPTARA